MLWFTTFILFGLMKIRYLWYITWRNKDRHELSRLLFLCKNQVTLCAFIDAWSFHPKFGQSCRGDDTFRYCLSPWMCDGEQSCRTIGNNRAIGIGWMLSGIGTKANSEIGWRSRGNRWWRSFERWSLRSLVGLDCFFEDGLSLLARAEEEWKAKQVPKETRRLSLPYRLETVRKSDIFQGILLALGSDLL